MCRCVHGRRRQKESPRTRPLGRRDDSLLQNPALMSQQRGTQEGGSEC
jgi:hypothetical protein